LAGCSAAIFSSAACPVPSVNEILA